MFHFLKKGRLEDSFLYVAFLTLLGGYVNAYAYFVRGGIFVSMQSGNMGRMGVALYSNDLTLFYNSFIPIIGCLTGVVIVQVLHHHLFTKKDKDQWQRFCLLASGVLLIPIGFIPSDFHNYTVNFCIALVSAFQLCNLRVYLGVVHNTTIASGNIRNLGQLIGDALYFKDIKTFIIALKYLIITFTFTAGSYIGSHISVNIGEKAIWIGASIILIFYGLLRLEEKYSPEAICNL